MWYLYNRGAYCTLAHYPAELDENRDKNAGNTSDTSSSRHNSENVNKGDSGTNMQDQMENGEEKVGSVDDQNEEGRIRTLYLFKSSC